jgi:hypothetical protein
MIVQAAKGITVDDSGGDVRVEITADKSEVSTKKIRYVYAHEVWIRIRIKVKRQMLFRLK